MGQLNSRMRYLGGRNCWGDEMPCKDAGARPLIGRHTRERGYPVRRGPSISLSGYSGILDRPVKPGDDN